ncbi:hypothetical protein [Segetibacter aerophilus]|uniref:Uncharacterized protein n=1 Tax=Segetibacter aerophilus TaxID=670293 RepID=A0A512BCT6_9BACT|nr:hypothetical protein [Segetibacter aerophilus]GEO09779.1 hypothetical protein SAE01_22750 [Segetibacter aerophilus]
MMEQISKYYPFIAAGCIAALVIYKFHLSKYLKHSEQFSRLYYPVEVVESRRRTLIRKQYFLSGLIVLLLASTVFMHFNSTASNLSSGQVTETPIAEKVSFKYKRKLYKVDVNVVTGNEEPVYKVYFKNTAKDKGNNTMHLFRKENIDGSVKWECRTDSSTLQNNEIASIAGAAIEKALQNRN